MEFNMTAICQLELSYEKGAKKSKHVATNTRLELSDNLDASKYLDKNGRPDKEGANVLTQIFIAGLTGNIHLMHEKGWRDSAEHLRYIISELERRFVEVTSISEGTMDK